MSTITISRTVTASPSDAFRAWVGAEEFSRWWWPQLPDTTYSIDATPGGAFAIHSAHAGFGVRGTYRVVDPASRLVFSWIWVTDGEDAAADGEPVIDEVEVLFTRQPEGRTEVTVHHTSVEELRGGGVEQGWNDVMDRLGVADNR